MSPEVIVSLDRLSKDYGNSRGIIDLTFDIYRGEVFGFLGPNGAGKTTAIRTLLGLIHATSGSATILGEDALANNAALRAHIGYLPGALNIYKNYGALEVLQYFAKMRGLNCDSQIHSYATRLNLDLTKKLKELSKGNRQKVGVIQAFMHEPELLFLDEPTSGLDPLAQREFEIMLEEVKARGASVMLSSHVLSEVEHLADRVAIINDGRLLVVDHIAHLKERALRTIELFFDEPVAKDVFENLPEIKSVEVRGTRVTCTIIGSETALLRFAVEHNVNSVQTHEPSLEDIFLNLVEAGAK